MANISIKPATISDPLKLINRDLGTGKKVAHNSVWPIKPPIFMRAVQMKPFHVFGLSIKVPPGDGVSTMVPPAVTGTYLWYGSIC
jgi:hypothetical protein